MRAILFGIMLAWTAFQAHGEPVYFLVDNSGSMADLRDSVDAEIESLVSEEFAASKVSVTYFQGTAEGDCLSPVTINPAAPPKLPLTLKPPSAQGSTLIVKAIESLRQIPSGEAATVHLYTDGSYADSVCETPEGICAALAALKVDRPLIDFSFQHPPAVRNAGAPVLSCAEPAPTIEVSAGTLTIKSDDGSTAAEHEAGGDDSGAGGKADQGATHHMPTILSWAAIPWLIVGLLAMNTFARRRFTKAIEESDEIQDPTSKPEPLEKWTVRLLHALLVAAVLCLIFFAFFGQRTWVSFVTVYNEANRPLLAIVFAWALTVVSGWYFVERMKDMQARQSKTWRLNHASALRRNEVREVGRIKDLLTSRLSEHQNLESLGILRQREFIADDDNWGRVEAVSAKVELVRTRLSEMVAEVDAFSVLDRHQTATYANARSITRLLIAAGKLDTEAADGANAFFENWKGFLRKLPTIDVRLETAILAFQIREEADTSKV